MRGLTLIVLTTMLITPAQAGDDQALNDLIEHAIANGTVPWRPPDNALRGLSVKLVSLGGDAQTAAARAADEMGLLTARSLYHLIRRAGGSASIALTPDAGALSEYARDTDLCIVVRGELWDGDASVQVLRLGGGDASDGSRTLAECLSAALGLNSAAEPVGGLQVAAPTCEILYRYPASDQRVHARAYETYEANARAIYEGLVRYVAQTRATGGETTDAPVAELTGKIARRARTLVPDGRLADERVAWFCETYARVSVTSHSLTVFSPSAEVRDGQVILRGTTNFPTLIDGLTEALRAVGRDEIRNEMRVLPNRQVLGDKLFGLCRVTMALTYNRPGGAGGLQTELLLGEPVFLLDRVDDEYLLHAGDGYWGWVAASAVQPLTAAEFDEYLDHPRGVVVADIETESIRVPRGARLPLAAGAGDRHTLLLPDGERVSVSAQQVRALDSSASTAEHIRAALDLLHVPYVFGGRSPLGLDCSGLITNIMTQSGQAPARDAWQQALAGELVATPWCRERIRAGDLLYFIDRGGRIYHTGIALNATHFVHATPPAVRIGSLHRGDRLYDEERDLAFFMAKRP